MNHCMKAALFGGALFTAGVAQADNTYRIDGPSTVASPTNYGYAWDGLSTYGAYLAPFRTAIENNYNFSHFVSYVDTKVLTGDFDYLNATVLFTADCIISPWWKDADTTSYEAYVAAYHFWNGGDLILFNDSPYTDYIGQYLGVPTQYGLGSAPISGTGFPFDGPFGTPASVNFAGSVGSLSVVDVFNTGGQVFAVDGSGNPTVAFWEQDAYSPGSGRMIIVTDVNTIGDLGGTAQYSPLNDNGRFALNLVAGMLAENKPGGADCDKNGILNIDDIDCFVNSFLNGEL